MITQRAGMGSVLLGLGMAVSMALGGATSAVAQTETVNFLHKVDPIALSAPSSELQSAPQSKIGVTFNEFGDLEVRYRYVTMTMAYNPPEDIQSPPDRLRTAQRPEAPSVSGISLRVSMAF